MRRRLFTALSVLSLVLCLTTVSLWVRSYRVLDRVRVVPRRGVQYVGNSRSGSIILSRSVLFGRTSNAFSDDLDAGPGWSVQSRPQFGPAVSPFTPEGSPPAVQWAGFDFLARDESRPGFGTVTFRRIVVPIWLLVLLTLLPLIPLGRRVLRRQRSDGRRCLVCGYNLTGNTSGVCPECGKLTTAGVKG